jgi:hypothetical protein
VRSFAACEDHRCFDTQDAQFDTFVQHASGDQAYDAGAAERVAMKEPNEGTDSRRTLRFWGEVHPLDGETWGESSGSDLLNHCHHSFF